MYTDTSDLSLAKMRAPLQGPGPGTLQQRCKYHSSALPFPFCLLTKNLRNHGNAIPPDCVKRIPLQFQNSAPASTSLKAGADSNYK